MKRKSLLKGPLFSPQWSLCRVYVTSSCINVEAQTVLKFSHTWTAAGSTPGGCRSIREEGRAIHERPLQGSGILLQRELGNDPKNIEQLVLGGIDFTVSSTGSYRRMWIR